MEYNITFAVTVFNSFLLFLTLKKTITMALTQKELAQKLVDFKAQLLKAKGEILDKIQKLVDAANNSDNVDPELQSAIDDLTPAVQALDDIVPDAPVDNGGGTTDDGSGGTTDPNA